VELIPAQVAALDKHMRETPAGFTPLHSEDDERTNDTIPTLIDPTEENDSSYEESQARGGSEDCNFEDI
jgi:hypothetical protein